MKITLKRVVKVYNMRSERSGRKITNQFRIYTCEGVYFQSYETLIVFIDCRDGQTYLDKNSWDYSATTSKYRNIFLGENRKETERRIKNGEYKLIDLNQQSKLQRRRK